MNLNVLCKKTCAAALQNCETFYSYIRYGTRKQPTMFCKYLFWKFESNHERFPIKIIEKYPWTSSFLWTLQACKLHPNQEMNFPAGICQGLSRHISNTYFLEHLQTAPSEPNRRATRIILCMQLTRVTLKHGVPHWCTYWSTLIL